VIRSWRWWLLTAVIAVAFGFLGARLGMQSPAPRMGQGTVRASVESLLQREFKLSSAQRASIDEIDRKFTRTHNLIWADVRMSNAELAAAVAEDMSLNPLAKVAIQEIQQSVGRLHTESILYVLEVRQVLTPEQRLVFDEHIIMALMRDPA
jgi:hypothetical protein